MLKTYFLGANSHKGFYSLYKQFAAAPGDFLHIIKGGPGTGKSGFMKKIAERAESKGLACQRVLCSGDPDSLDGLYIPELKLGWVDGTAPHVCEPGLFGVSGNYVNLGVFCHIPSALNYVNLNDMEELNGQYKRLYAQAYGALAAAEELRGAVDSGYWTGDRLLSAQKRICAILHRHGAVSKSGKKEQKHCFASAISCKGLIRLSEEVNGLCKLKYILENDYQGADILLQYAADKAGEMGLDMICCHSPLRPERIEGLILPATGLGLFSSEWDEKDCRHIRLDEMIPLSVQREQRSQRRRTARIRQECMDLAVEKLSQAKALHDRLEACYRPYMDFDALSEFTENEIEKLLEK